MRIKYQIQPEQLGDYRFRHLIAESTRYKADLWCYVKPIANEIEYCVQQGHNETWFKTLPEAIAAYNAL